MKRTAVVLLVLLAGCSVGPDYRPPPVDVPARFGEPSAPPATPTDVPESGGQTLP